MISTAKVDKNNVLGVDSLNQYEFITVGTKHIKEWTINGSSLVGKRASWGNEK